MKNFQKVIFIISVILAFISSFTFGLGFWAGLLLVWLYINLKKSLKNLLKKSQNIIFLITIFLQFLSSIIPGLGFSVGLFLISLYININKSVKKQNYETNLLSETSEKIQITNKTTIEKETYLFTKNTDSVENRISKESKYNSKNNDYIENKISKESKYNPYDLDSTVYENIFNNLPNYDINQSLDNNYIESLKAKKELDYEKYMKCSITTSRPENFVVLDFETTGLKAEKNYIIQIGAIKYNSYKPIESFSSYVNPNKKITPKITSITGITNNDVKDAPSIDKIIPHLLNFIDDYTIVAHNAPFDMSFLYYTLFKYGYKKPKNKVIDTLRMARKEIKEYDYIDDKERKLDSYKLEVLKDKLSLYDIGSHDALEDCKVCGYVYIKIETKLYDYLLV